MVQRQLLFWPRSLRRMLTFSKKLHGSFFVCQLTITAAVIRSFTKEFLRDWEFFGTFPSNFPCRLKNRQGAGLKKNKGLKKYVLKKELDFMKEKKLKSKRIKSFTPDYH